ncbi:MAG: tryptophan synthase subunit alpha [Candidatus Zixiibacteriota bacterium]
MITLNDAFTRTRENNRKALMPFLTSGYPSQTTFIKLMNEMSLSGADIIEVGIPFSDPMADGKTIQYSSEAALKNGIDINITFKMLRQLDDGFNSAVVIMSYFNPIYQFGIGRFFKEATQIGINGLIIPDLIPDEGYEIEQLAKDYDLNLIYLLAPTTNKERQAMILRHSRGFIYLVTMAGVTGARAGLPVNLNELLEEIKELSPIPVCAGFGISKLSQVRDIARYADGVIVGSALIDKIKSAKSEKAIITEIGMFIRHLKGGLGNE